MGHTDRHTDRLITAFYDFVPQGGA